MERVVFVEVLGRRGDVAHRLRLAQLPATIGRAWTNDIILADPHVDAQHARIVEDEQGGIAVEDLGSVNGLYSDGTLTRVARVVVGGLTPVRIGRTQLRVVTAGQAVPPAVRDLEPTGPLARLFVSPRAMTWVGVIGTVTTVLFAWLSDYSEKTAVTVTGSVLALMVGVAVWAGIWAFAGRLIIHRARFWQHLAVAWLMILAYDVWGRADAWLAFFFPVQRITGFVSVVGSTALFLAVIAIHAGLASYASLKRRLALGVGLLAGFGLLAWVGEKATQDEFLSDTVTIEASIKPVPASLIPAHSVDEFMNQLVRVQREVDLLNQD